MFPDEMDAMLKMLVGHYRKSDIPNLQICEKYIALAGRSPAVVRLSIDRIEKNIESIESKITKIFKRPKNREDGSDFDDFLTESIVSP